MSVSSKADPSSNPDDVFACSPWLQELQRLGLHDQAGPANAWPATPKFHVIPESLIAECGGWTTAMLGSEAFRTQFRPSNEIALPHGIAASIVAEGRSINPPFDAYVRFIRRGLNLLVEKAGAGAAPGTPEFERRFMSHMLAWIARLTPDICSGAIPLSRSMPGSMPRP